MKDKRVINYFLWAYLTLIIMMIGMTFNFVAITENQGRMPFKSDYWGPLDEGHIAYYDSSQVKYTYLSDIISLGRRKASIGDFLMIFGLIGLVTSFIFIKREIGKWQLKK